MSFILDPTELARTLVRDLGPEGGLRYAEMIGRGGTELGVAYKEAYKLLQHRQKCHECDQYPANKETGICDGCEAYAEHTAV